MTWDQANPSEGRFVNAVRFFEEQGLFRLPHVIVLKPEPPPSSLYSIL